MLRIEGWWFRFGFTHFLLWLLLQEFSATTSSLAKPSHSPLSRLSGWKSSPYPTDFCPERRRRFVRPECSPRPDRAYLLHLPPRSASCATSCHKHFKRNFLQPSWIRNLICAVSLARVTQIEPLEACLVSWGSFFFMKRIVLGKLKTNADPSTFPGLTWQILQYCCWQSFIFLNFAAVPLFIPWPHWSCANLRTKWATAQHLPSVLLCVCRICSTAISTQLFSYKGNSANIKTQQNISIITITVIVISS